MKRIVNVEETLKLVERYRSITGKEIRESIPKSWLKETVFEVESYRVLNKITGFGFRDTCSLCKTCYDEENHFLDCNKCIHSTNIHKDNTENRIFCVDHYTYRAIEKVKTITGLLTAIKNRANYLEKLVNKYEKKLCGK